MDKSKIRVRFAPSPTGALHIGGLRTALFNWLLARQKSGSFVLRIEDTDQKRLVPGSEAQIINALKWLSLDYDEGPAVGGPHGPYRQSERLETYKEYALQLVKQGSAYYCNCSSERLEKLRQDQQSRGEAPRYDRRCRELNLPPDSQTIIRLKIPITGSTVVQDLIRGEVSFQNDLLDDQVLLKADGYPTYHLATPIDDYLMGITHVMRGDEWLASLPKHLIMYRALSWTPPIFIHLPLILGSDHQKLSKRHGATSVQSFIEEGYLPQALFNFLALLGWHPRGNQEIMTIQEILGQFSLDSLQKSGAVFNRAKLDWLNGVYFRQIDDQTAAQVSAPFLAGQIEAHYEAKLDQAVSLVRDRVKKLSELPELLSFIRSGFDYETDLLLTKGAADKKLASEILQALNNWLTEYSADFETDKLAEYFKTKISAAGWSNKRALWPLRVALTGLKASPGTFEVMAFLGKTECQKRLAKAISKLNN